MNKKVESEEAINNLKKLIKLRKNKCEKIKFDTCICGTNDLEMILNKLDELEQDNQSLRNYLSEQGMISNYIYYKRRHTYDNKKRFKTN